MTFTADQFAQIAQHYESAAADSFVPSEKKRDFAKQAEWYRYLSTREQGRAIPHPLKEVYSESPRRSYGALLTTLWLTGAAVYVITTLVFTNALGVFGDRSRKPSQPAEVTLPAKISPQPASTEENARSSGSPSDVKAAAQRRHAISPDQPPYEAPELIKPLPVTEHENVATVATERPEEVAAPADPLGPELFQVIKAAKIRNGPSNTSKIIGTAIPGAELQVTSQQNGWIQFVDPSSGNSGWIQADLVAGISPSDEIGAPSGRPAATSAAAPPKKALVKKGEKQKRPLAKAARSPENSSPNPKRGYAGLPHDEEFFRDRGSRMGIFARRRMLREGLLSPGFQPPE
jgi:hypothetical protein